MPAAHGDKLASHSCSFKKTFPCFQNKPSVPPPCLSIYSKQRTPAPKKEASIPPVLDRLSTTRTKKEMQTPPQPPPPPHHHHHHHHRQQQQIVLRIKDSAHGHRDQSSASEDDDEREAKEEEQASRSALSSFRAKEEQIERKKMEVREKVFAQLGRAEEETKRLTVIQKELEAMADPTRKEVSAIRKRIDAVNRELRPLGHNCLKKEKEYKEALEAFNGKNREKTQLVTKLMELVSESERLRMKKLEELSRIIDSIR